MQIGQKVKIIEIIVNVFGTKKTEFIVVDAVVSKIHPDNRFNAQVIDNDSYGERKGSVYEELIMDTCCESEYKGDVLLIGCYRPENVKTGLCRAMKYIGQYSSGFDSVLSECQFVVDAMTG